MKASLTHRVSQRLKSPPSPLWIALAALLVIEIVTVFNCRGPVPLPPVVAAGDSARPQFSAARAIEIHRQLFPQEPHPAGSSANAEVRRKLVALLETDGWSVSEQSAAVETRRGGKVNIVNVIARRAEQTQLTARPSVLATHYDSCRFGPGAGDAGGCVVAVLEAGRLLTAKPDSLTRPLMLAFTDGEEDGLPGAIELAKREEFQTRPPLVLNFDAREPADRS
jgi:acetylornithine deacetylase/succinyl-diaminopimelate desuccinylase-like protein